MASSPNPKVFYQFQITAATLQGLVANDYYVLTPNTATGLSGAIATNPLLTMTPANLATAGVYESNGIFFLNPVQHSCLELHVSNLSMTGLVGCTLSLYPLIYPFFSGAPIIAGNPASLAIATGGTNIMWQIPTVPGAVTIASGGAGTPAAQAFLPTLTATTWPSVGAILSILLKVY